MKNIKTFEDFSYIDVAGIYDTGTKASFNRFKNENPMLELEEEYHSLNVKDFEKYLENKYGIELFISYSKITKFLDLDKIVVNKNERNQGIGSKVMKEICDYCDKNEIIICLTPSSDFGGNVKRLNDFYKKFGFIKRDSFETKQSLMRYPK